MGVATFRDELFAIRGKYQRTLTDLDYGRILTESLAAYERAAAGRPDTEKLALRKDLEAFLFSRVAALLHRAEYKDFVHMLKVGGVTGDAIYGKKGRFIPARFLKTRIFVYMLRTDRMLFFVNQYRLFQNRSVRRFYRFVRQVITERSLEPFRYLLPGRLRLPPIQVIITEKCTLRCKKCAYLTNLYRQPRDVGDSVTLETLRKLQEYSDRIDDLIFVGGEPFCNPNLKHYIQAISPDICRKVEITTNGTILPDDPELLAAMREKRVQVTFSNYGALSGKQEQAVKLLRDNAITCVVYSPNMPWYDFGAPEPRQIDRKELDRQFSKCGCADIFNVMNGIVDVCPRSSHGGNLGLMTVPGDERADILHLDRKEFIKQMKKLLRRDKALTACRYCVYMTDACAVIPRAEQEEGV